MFLEMDHAEECVLAEVVREAIERLEGKGGKSPTHPESLYDREQRLEILKRLQRHLSESEFDVTC